MPIRTSKRKKGNDALSTIKVVFAAAISFVSVRVFFLNSRILSSMPEVTPIAGSLGDFVGNYSSSLELPPISSMSLIAQQAPPSSGRQAGSLENLPEWMQEYFNWHRQQRSQLNEQNWKEQKYLIVSCRKNQKCGGLADRLKPLPLFILVASQTKRIFMILWDKPAALEEFMEPNEINWSVPTFIRQNINNNQIRVPTKRGEKNLRNLASEENMAVFVQLQDFHGGSFIYDKMIAEAYNDTNPMDRYHFIYHDLFRFLFKPSPPVRRLIDDQLNKSHITPGEYSIAHYRAFYAIEEKKDQFNNQTLVREAINSANCGSHLRPGGPVYFASDSKIAVDAVVDYGRKNSLPIVAYDGPEPLHIEKEWQDRNTSEFYSIFVDLHLMGNGRCVAFGKGGFGRYALMMGFNSTCELRYLYKGKKTTCEWKEKK